MNNFLPRLLLFIIISLVCIPFYSQGLPKFKVEHGKKTNGTPKVKITNETPATLACFIAIDGHKKKFVLTPLKSSRWYVAADNRYDHTSFRTWCGLLDLYPAYKKYRK